MNHIEQLRKFFRASNIVFEIVENIQLALTGYLIPNEMHQLHKIALNEIEKENPDLSIIYKLLERMELISANN